MSFFGHSVVSHTREAVSLKLEMEMVEMEMVFNGYSLTGFSITIYNNIIIINTKILMYNK